MEPPQQPPSLIAYHRKRRLIDTKKTLLPPPPPPQQPSLTASSSTDFKKTRDLPNLSDCHACPARINFSNPKDRLVPLDSVWRIVLLCKNCIRGVRNSELCPYCFKTTTEGHEAKGGVDSSCFKCGGCKRRIHNDCFLELGSGLGFGYRVSGEEGVCVDCWVPEPVVKMIAAGVKRKRKNKDAEGVSGCGIVDAAEKNVEGSEKETVDCGAKVKDAKEIIACGAKGNVLKKNVVANGAVSLSKEKGVNGRVILNKENKEKGGNGDGNVEKKVLNDAELAFLLHRAMNSSRRISRNVGLVVPEIWDSVGSSSGGGGISNVSEKNNGSVSESLACNKAPDCGSSNGIKEEAIVDKMGSDGNEGNDNCGEICNTETDKFMLKYRRKCERRRSLKPNRYLLKYRRSGKQVFKSLFIKTSQYGSIADSDNIKTGANWNLNRYMLKYRRTKISNLSKKESCGPLGNSDSACVLSLKDSKESGKSAVGMLKYRRTKISKPASLGQKESCARLGNSDSACLTSLSDSKESRKSVVGMLQSCPQAFVGASGSSR